MLYFLEEEFQSKALVDGRIFICSSETISLKYNSDEFNSLDGEMVRAADQLAAYIEASMSIAYGIKAPDLLKGKGHIYDRHAGSRIGGIDFRRYYDYFKE
jgi:putative hydrolase of HD superfamily